MDAARHEITALEQSWNDPYDRIRLQVEHRNSCLLIKAAGEIDHLTANAFRDYVISHCVTTRRIILDLQGVTFCDSSGLGGLVGIWKAATAHDRRLVLSRPSPLCHRILQRTGLDEHITISVTLHHAFARLSADQGDLKSAGSGRTPRRRVS
ncbi:STAS domain-containing protein [Actinomadura sp. BRA 177]|uniref:STAS domain-containing protein n=1 Tax=Actinomadura sp. BRA 177 TaxID=2745202 RepID=UPI001595C709|nr:STAS domain-containing protein [Actinomadura sp. BRA 177]NVI90976.1 STAS domain-containing protein [Actinomadura sp. BRA 177]